MAGNPHACSSFALTGLRSSHAARDQGAPDLGDVLTLATPRTDDPIKGVPIPASHTPQPQQSRPSVLEKIHASKVSLLPLRNQHGVYDQHTPPDLSTSDALGDYVQMRTTEWDQHLQRLARRRAATRSTPRRSRAGNR